MLPRLLPPVLKKLLFILAGFLIVLSMYSLSGPDWQTADRSSAGIAPIPSENATAIVQVYAARAFSWRGLLAVHTWIATKAEGAQYYNVYQVLGWRQRRGLPVVAKNQDIPDKIWFGNRPRVLREIKGEDAEKIILEIEKAVALYPYTDTYRLWPGPNSNTFIAHIGRSVPALQLDMPPTAIGKDYLSRNRFIETPPSGNGIQYSFFGLFSVIVSGIEGVEINILGISFGLGYTTETIWPLKLRLPFVGIIKIGSDDVDDVVW